MSNHSITPLPAFKTRPVSHQLYLNNDLSHRLITSGGYARTIAGDFAEEATAVLTDGRRMKTDSRCLVCPDVKFNIDTFFETKSVGNTKSAIVYRCRLVKDRHFINEYHTQLYYWFWFHKAEVLKSETIQELRADIAKTIYTIAVVEFSVLEKFLLAKPVKILNTAYIKTGPNSGSRLGYGKKSAGLGPRGESYDYGDGWNVRLVDILGILTQYSVTISLPRKVYGEEICNEQHKIEYRFNNWSDLRFVKM